MASLPIERHLLRARDLADARYTEQIGVTDLAAAAGLSQAHFTRAFRAAFGVTPHGYLLTRRLERAAALLRNTDHSVADICMEVGLASVGSFTTSFKRMFGRTPADYRAAFPPVPGRFPLPSCVVRKYARPEHRTFREDAAPAPSLASPSTPEHTGPPEGASP
ncbi:AraC family transcriptional regulator [Nocardioides sp. KR10-350]|uniref:AraC family transcriptional regulator n=1 Tax=Nocardioides cheoyonin TaxID=3156615 RepID=UPI0032B608A4